MTAILKVRRKIETPTPSIDVYLLEEHFCQISSRSDLFETTQPWAFLMTLPARIRCRTTLALYLPVSATLQGIGDDPVVVRDRRGYVPLRKTSKNRICGLWTAWFYAQDRVPWRKVMETATLQ